MKTKQANSIILKKLTIARINTNMLKNINGGSSNPPTGTEFLEQGTARRPGGACYQIP